MASIVHFTAEQALQLLDFSRKIDVPLLDAVVTSFYSTVGSEVRVCGQRGEVEGLEAMPTVCGGRYLIRMHC